jgi:isoprenylcysteine carboxyl methyltransferase (ICMT) family protein YpbQ
MVRFVTWAPLACYAVLVGVELTNPPPRREGTTRAGAYFTRTVQVSSDQPIVETGPYRLVRHPC